MRIAYTKPAGGERYLVGKNEARALARIGDPHLDLLAFQTRHGPNMTKGLPYCATYSNKYLRILSVDEGLVSDVMCQTFTTLVLPWLLNRIVGFRTRQHSWPCVVVALDGTFIEASCADGGLFPSIEDVRRTGHGIRSIVGA